MLDKAKLYIEGTGKCFNRTAKEILPSFAISFITFYEDKERTVKSFKKNKKYMTPGQYGFDKTFEYIHLHNEETTMKASKMLDNEYLVQAFNTLSRSLKRMVQKVVIYFLSRNLTVEKRENGYISEFQGQILLPCGIHNSFKIFDLMNKRVLLIFSKKEEYEKKLFDYNHFNYYFPQPIIVETCDKSLMITEELIDFKPYTDWSKTDFSNAILDIFNRTIDYFKDVLDNENYILKSAEELIKDINKKENLLENIINGISGEVKKTRFPFVRLHGDLWTSNILIDEADDYIKYIDFEHSDNFVFFYDIFLLIWTDFYSNKNTMFINELLCGKYDFYFEQMFVLFNMKFYKGYMVDYINIFFLEYYKKRWFNESEADLIKFHELYKIFISFKPGSDCIWKTP